MKDAEVDQRQLNSQVEPAEPSRGGLRRNNQTLKHNATQWGGFVNECQQKNASFYAGVSAVAAERGESALGARVPQRIVHALKNRVALLEKSQDQAAHEYEKVKQVAQGMERMGHQERGNSAILVQSLQELLTQERDAREFALQDLRRRLAQERTMKESALQLLEDSTAKEQPSAATMCAARRICAVAALGPESMAVACIAAQKHVRRARRKRGDAFPWGAWPRDAAVDTHKQAGRQSTALTGASSRSCHVTKRFRILATLKQGNESMYSNTSGYVHMGLRLDWGKSITGQ